MKKKLPYILFCVFATALVVTGFLLARYYINAMITEKEMKDLAELKNNSYVSSSEEKDNDTKKDAKSASTSAVSANDSKKIFSKYEKVYEKNRDLVGWLQIDDTKIDYPVLQRMDDNEYYLHRNFYEKDDDNGVPFMDIHCSIDNPNQNMVIYGHHMKSGLMFTDLLKYRDKEFFLTHKMINFDTIYKAAKYRIFGVCYMEINNGIASLNYDDYMGSLDEKMFESYISKIKDISLYNTDYTPTYGQDIITLITCSYHVKDGRFAVVAAKIGD